MSLSFTRPDVSLARELREVSQNASALELALTTGLNFELPTNFPVSQLTEITQSLADLPNGTAEGSRTPLEYARNRLPAIRREHVLIEDFSISAGEAEGPPAVVRGTLIDELLLRLIGSVTTAYDEYRRLASEESSGEPEPEPQVAPSGEIVEDAVKQSLRLGGGFDEAEAIVNETTRPESKLADELRRQISDGQGLNRIARAELRMPKVAVNWYRATVEALKQYPSLIRNASENIKLGMDVFEIAIDRWHDFERNTSQLLINEIRKTCDAFSDAADKIDEKRRRKITVSSGKPEGEFHIEVARAMILAGRQVPNDWIPLITELDFGTRRIFDLAPLAGLTHLTSLTHVSATVRDLQPLSGLSNLERLSLPGIHASNLAPLASLKKLRHLDLGGAWVGEIGPLSELPELRYLNLHNTSVSDCRSIAMLSKLEQLLLSETLITSLAELTALENLHTLNLGTTKVRDVAPLAHLNDLQRLYLWYTEVDDVTPLAGLSKLRTLDLEGTKVADITSLSSLTKLRQLDLKGTRVSDVSPLSALTQLSSLDLTGTAVKDITILQRRGLIIRGVPLV